jgi:hypothetical protein
MDGRCRQVVFSSYEHSVLVAGCLVILRHCINCCCYVTSNKIRQNMSMGRHCVPELRPWTGLLFIAQVMYEHGESHGGMILTGENRRTRRKTCSSATLSATNPTWTNAGLRGEKSAATRLSHVTAIRMRHWEVKSKKIGRIRPWRNVTAQH